MEEIDDDHGRGVTSPFDLVEHYFDSGRLDLVEDQLRRMLAQDPANAAAHTQLARLRLQQGRFDEAIDATSEALATAPQYPHAHSVRGLALRALGRFTLAEKFFLEALRNDPDYVAAFGNYALLMYDAGFFGKARRLALEGLKLNPESSWLLRILSDIEAATADRKAAMAAAEAALRLDPNEEGGHHTLAQRYFESGHPFQARECLREALRLDPSDSSLRAEYHRADRFCRWPALPSYLYARLVSRVPGRQVGFWVLVFVILVVLRALFGPSLALPGIVASLAVFWLYLLFAPALTSLWLRLRPPR